MWIMESRKYRFLQAVLGEDGARALAKASARSREIEPALLPRAIMAWLGSAGLGDYEGDIPGVPDTYLQFRKSEEGRFTGSVSIDRVVYTFKRASPLHLAASIAVAVGADQESLSPSLRDLDIQRLGKSLDTLVKARAVVAELRKMRTSEEQLAKTIADTKVGVPVEGKSNTWDYSHLLSPQHTKAGYKLHVGEPDTELLHAKLRHGQLEVGSVNGTLSDRDEEGNPSLKIGFAEIPNPKHRGRGLGQLMYEALMTHAFHTKGVREVHGGNHSTMASMVHKKLSRQHGMDYSPKPTTAARGDFDEEPGDFDNRVGPYQYAIKDEMEPGGGKGGAQLPGPQAEPRGPMEPVQALQPQAKQTSKGRIVPVHPKPPNPPAPSSTIPVAGQPQEQKRQALPSMAVGKSQASQPCSVCGIPQFRGNLFRGCMCLRDLAKSVKTIPTSTGYRLEFGKDWDEDSVAILVEALGEK